MQQQIVLIGCGKAKRTEPCRADQLYCGSLFSARRRYAEHSRQKYWIVSAKHGLLSPNCEIAPYDLTVSKLAEIDRISWGIGIVQSLLSQLADETRLRGVTVELHMGADYADLLTDFIQATGMKFAWPVKGMSQGAQMRWYSDLSITRMTRQLRSE